MDGREKQGGILMGDSCCSKPQAGSEVCEMSSTSTQQEADTERYCPNCGEKGKLVQGQTVKALYASSLRQLEETNYYFCRTQSCAIVYFSSIGKSVVTTSQLRERVYQKEPDADDVFVCYCFKHTVVDIRNATQETRDSIVEDINAGIQANQCACDLRNPQGSCCLGNVRRLIKQVEASSAK